MMRRLRSAGLAVMMCAIAACGFHLRGSYELPQHLSPIFIDKDSMSLPLYKQLRSSLAASGVELADDAATAASVFEITREQKARNVIAVDSLGRAREYRLSCRLAFSLRASGETGIENSNIHLPPNLLFDPEAVLGVDRELDVIYKDMIRDSTGQMLLRLQAMK
mgnify:CR=1 FL=1